MSLNRLIGNQYAIIEFLKEKLKETKMSSQDKKDLLELADRLQKKTEEIFERLPIL